MANCANCQGPREFIWNKSTENLQIEQVNRLMQIKIDIAKC